MKRVEHSEYILIRAFTDSEWDNCDFAVIHTTAIWKKTLKERIGKAAAFKEDTNFYHLSYWGSPEGFYKDPEDETQWADAILQQDDWCFIELEEGTLDKLLIPENKLGVYQMIVDKNGAVYYKAYGEYSGEEFYTAEFTAADLLETIIL